MNSDNNLPIEDPNAEHGERYENVSHEEMGRMWREQDMIPMGYLNFAPADRHKTHEGKSMSKALNGGRKPVTR